MRNFISDTIKSTLSQIIGRSVNIVIPFFVISYYGATSATDLFFLAMSVSFYFYGTISNAFNDTLSATYIVSRKYVSAKVIVIISFFAVLLTLAFLLCFSEVALTTDGIGMVVIFSVISGIGLTTIRSIPLLTAQKDFISPGLTWIFRGIPIILLAFFFREEHQSIFILAAGILLADSVRALLLEKLSEKHKSAVAKKLHLHEIYPMFVYIIGTLLQGLNPIVDRTIASFSETGGVTILETADRIFWTITMVLTTGIQSVMLVSISRYYSEGSFTRYIWKTIILTALGLGAVGSVLIFFFRIIVESQFGDLLFSSISLSDRMIISESLLYYALLCPILAMSTACARVLIVANKNFQIFKACLLSLFLNTILSIWFYLYFAIPGIVLGTLVSHVATFVYVCYMTKEILPHRRDSYINP